MDCGNTVDLLKWYREIPYDVLKNGVAIPSDVPSMEFLLLTQGPFPEILVKKCSELVDLKNCLFLKQQNSKIQNSKKLKFFCPIPQRARMENLTI